MHLTRRSSIAGWFTAGAALLCLATQIRSQAASAQDPASPLPAPPPQNAQAPPAPAQTPPGSAMSAPPAQPPDWKTYSFAADGFSASFPTDPVKQKRTVATDAGAVELRTYLAASDTVALYVGVCDYGEAASGGDPDAILEGAKNGAVANVNAHLIDSRKVTLGIYPGVAFEAAAEGAHFYGRIYLVGTTLYQAFVALQSNQPYPDTARFLDSFQLIPRPSP
jgi:hypothetical protein